MSTEAIHAATLTLDTHVDIRWPDPPDATQETDRCVDFPKMARGGLKGVVFIAYVPQGRRDDASHAAAAVRAEAMLRHIRGRADGVMRRFCASAAAIAAADAAGAQMVIAAVENGYAMGRDLSRLALWRELGAIYVTLTHNGHNALADSAIPRPDLGDPPEEHGGLSPLGRQAVAEMNRLGLLVDVSHVSKKAMLDAVAASRVPVVATHTCCAALRAHPRNVDDEQLDALRATGGLAQITAVASFLREGEKGRPTVAHVSDIADHVDHAVKRIGIQHVGLSSDFDGGGGVLGWANAAESAALTTELVRRGYDAAAVGLLWSGNFLRLMRAAEEAAS
ncbi:membrane dipeptidase [Roseomonas hellenica]|uniref:Membrane dipeptidase n=1 Tax=Plastoroseomonas hellenica TaxID=2687306 RepID=A0ABS5ESY5_9PROT|nr:membrane dipeptidase [Plastoroseomonas hellenica]